MATKRSARNVVVLGKTGAGKSSVANNILNAESFMVADSPGSVTKKAEMCQVVIQYNALGVEYEIKVIDTVGLFDSDLSNKKVIDDVKLFFKNKVPEGVHLILFVFSGGRFTAEERDTFRYIMKNFQDRDISDISALIITHCEGKSAKAREKIITEFKEHELTRDIATFMKKGVVCVGFPTLEDADEDLREKYERTAKDDTDKLHHLVSKSADIRLKEDDPFWKRCTIL